MITNFEEQTAPLNDKEKTFLPDVILILKESNKDRPVTNASIAAQIKNNYNINFPDSRIRKIINHIRRNKLLVNILASSRGYFLSDSKEELEEYVLSLIERSESILEVALSFENISQELKERRDNLGKQLEMRL